MNRVLIITASDLAVWTLGAVFVVKYAVKKQTQALLQLNRMLQTAVVVGIVVEVCFRDTARWMLKA